MVTELYIDSAEAERQLIRAESTSSALRYAQEYEAAFGRPALTDLIREETRDDEFEPGEILESLVDLPWADVFTTNYDRMLEWATRSRSSKTLRKQTYEVVTSAAHLPLARPPRIVKLHGSLPSLDGLVITEDDFRKYPLENPAFVGLVRASLCENAFCLFGFSGDDPNFLAWTGWVRDTLALSAPSLYLFCLNEPKHFQRRLLEERHVIPIPLTRVSQKENLKDALKWVLNFLAQEPSLANVAWNRPPDVVAEKSEANEQTSPTKIKHIDVCKIWKKNRLKYGGWNILHIEGIKRLWIDTQFWLRYTRYISNSTHEIWQRVFFSRELTWRMSTCLHPLFDSIVFNNIDPMLIEVNAMNETQIGEACRSHPSFLLDVFAIRCELLRHAREIGDSKRFEVLYRAIESDELKDENIQNFLFYQHALLLLGQLKAKEAQQIISNWNTNSDSIWSIRKAGLLLELGNFSTAIELLNELANELTVYRSSRNVDLRARSAEGLVLFLLSACDQFQTANSRTPLLSKRFDPTKKDSENEMIGEGDIQRRLRELRPLGCDPRPLLQNLRDSLKTRHEFKDIRTVKASFDIGSETIDYRLSDVDEMTDTYRALRFIEDSGIPLQIHGVIPLTITAKVFENATHHISQLSTSEGLGLVLRSRSEKQIKSFFNRQRLINTTEAQVDSLLTSATKTVNEAMENLDTQPTLREHNDQWWEQQLGVALTVMDRIIPKLSDAAITNLSELFISILTRTDLWKRHGISPILGSFIDRFAKCMPSQSLLDHAAMIMELPIPGSDEFLHFGDHVGNWRDPLTVIEDNQRKLKAPKELEAAINKSIYRISQTEGVARQILTQRLVSFFHQGFLSREQTISLRDAILVKNQDGIPTDTNCFPSILLTLPKKTGFNEQRVLKTFYLSSKTHRNGDYWKGLAKIGAVNSARPKQRTLRWTSHDLSQLLIYSGTWLEEFALQNRENQKWKDSEYSFMHAFGEPQLEKQRQEGIAWALFLDCVIIPSQNLTDDQRTECTRLLDKANKAGIPHVATTASRYLTNMTSESMAFSQIRDAILSQDREMTPISCYAIRRCIEFAVANQIRVPNELIIFVVHAIRMRHPQRHLYISMIADLIKVLPKLLSKKMTGELYALLVDLLTETEYDTRTYLSVEEKLNLRISCAELTGSLIIAKKDHKSLALWKLAIESDLFAEVRRSGENNFP
ncbi:hypothetical protein DSM3645_21067 [Blastopirellula marina DSM 3645]|uniref:Uncharacterized protein n=2 Tax=Blastopirellula marina TaxID=124 RepID=A3ZR10_9BACT|nr:hypothetical protein DSM3645_21067 [Blastopirellula marina DSM 3645]